MKEKLEKHIGQIFGLSLYIKYEDTEMDKAKLEAAIRVLAIALDYPQSHSLDLK